MVDVDEEEGAEGEPTSTEESKRQNEVEVHVQRKEGEKYKPRSAAWEKEFGVMQFKDLCKLLNVYLKPKKHF